MNSRKKDNPEYFLFSNKMTTHRFRKLFDANIYEMFWLQEVDMNDKLAVVRQQAKKRITALKAQNKHLDEVYYNTLSANEPIKYEKLQNYLEYDRTKQ